MPETNNDHVTLENVKEIVLTAVEQMHRDQNQAQANAAYERSELRKWAVEQAIVKQGTGPTMAATIITEANALVDWVEGS